MLNGGTARRAALAASRAAARERDLCVESKRSAAKARELRQSAGLSALLDQFHAEQARENRRRRTDRPHGGATRSTFAGGCSSDGANMRINDTFVAKYAAAARERQRVSMKAGAGVRAASVRCVAQFTTHGEAHEQQWRLFCANPPRCIGFDNIPWPRQPVASVSSAAAALCAALGLEPPPGTHLAAWDPGRDPSLKMAMRNAMLRWHPDKFEQAFGARLTQDPDERGRILERVRSIMQHLVEAKARWDALYRPPITD